MNEDRLADRQAAASRQGAQFEKTVETLLQVEGWTIEATHWRHPEVDVEIDFVAVDPVGVKWWIECKGSWESPRNGLERTDTAKKAIGSAAILALLDDRCPYMLVTSHLPRLGSSGDMWMRRAVGRYFDAVRVVQPLMDADYPLPGDD
jgi:Holliday junction resolvase-like predicted endonuclease